MSALVGEDRSRHVQTVGAVRDAHDAAARLEDLLVRVRSGRDAGERWHRLLSAKLAHGDFVDADGGLHRATRTQTGRAAQHFRLGRDITAVHPGTGSVTVTVLSGIVLEGVGLYGKWAPVEAGESREYWSTVRLRSETGASVSVTHTSEIVVPASREGATFPLLTVDGWVFDAD